VPAFSATAPVLCIADIQTGAGGTITNIYDTRIFTTTTKTFATMNAASTAGMQAVLDTARPNSVKTTTTANAGSIRGVVAVGNSTASSTAVNVILAIAGPAYMRSTGATAIGDTIQTSTVAGYALSSGTPSTNIYGNAGLVLRAADTTCTAAANCQYSIFTDLNIR
jgi:hypothetical protein